MEPLKRIENPKYPVSRIEDKPEVVLSTIDYDELKRRQRFMESGFNDNLKSSSGAKGRYQIMPITHKEYVQLTGNAGDLMDPVYNEQIRDFYMEKRLPQFEVIKEGNPTDSVLYAKKLAAYNWGPGNLRKHMIRLKKKGVDVDNSMDWVDTMPTEPRNYVNFILRGQDVNKYKNNDEYQKVLDKYGKNK